MGFDSGIWDCAICGKTVSRLLGMAGGVELNEGGSPDPSGGSGLLRRPPGCG